MAVVVIPAYQPDETLVTITDRLWVYGCRIVVVDDGSGKEYQSLFERLEDICVVLHHRKNRGKGAAIKTGLRYIKREFWDSEVVGTMDADGQHLPDDMIRLLESAREHPDALILGVRKTGKEMPLRSRLGNQITRAVFHLLSGVKVSDTQTGLRAFGAQQIERMCQIRGERYEYEMNVLMETARAQIPITEVDIPTIYRDRENSTSHFQTVKDSVRIYKELLKFTASSFSSFLLDYLLFTLGMLIFPHQGMAVILVNILARILSACYNYTMNCRFVFHTRWNIETAVDYFALAGCILFMNNLVLEILLRIFHLPVYGAKLMTEMILFVLSWLIQNNVIFRSRKKGRTCAEES